MERPDRPGEATGLTFTRDIPLTDIKVGDHVRAMVLIRGRRKSFCNLSPKTPRNGTVTEIVGQIVRIDCRFGGIYNVKRDDIKSAWGYR